MSEADLQSLAKVALQADPIIERIIHAVLGAAYGTHGRGHERLATGPHRGGIGDFCAVCGRAGVLWKDLTPCSYRGQSFNAHLPCFAALTAGAGR
jgi:hypothetical protein